MEQSIELHHLQTNGQPIQGEPISLSSSPFEFGSSSSSSSSSSFNTNTPQSPTNIPINAGHISMLLKNDIQGFKSEIQNLSDLSSETDHKNSIFHLAASIGQSEFINKLASENRALLTLPNSNHDLPIHVAARACQFGVVKTLVEWAQHFDELGSMLEAKNKEGNTALHIALQNQQQNMSWFLYDNCPKTFYSNNSQKISPLYLAIKAEFWDLVKYMLYQGRNHTVAETHLLDGYSVIHAAIVAKNIDIVVMILSLSSDLMYLEDEKKRYPISYAAYTGFLDGVKYILPTFQNQAFKMDANGWYPIHWACSGGYLKIVKCFFTYLPEKARLLLTKNGQSILHVAAASGRTEIVKFILRQPECATMINMKDKDGNGPLHLASMGKHPCVVYALTWDDRVLLRLQNNKRETALDLAYNYGEYASFNERMTWLSLRYAGVPSAPQYHYFNDVLIMEPTMVNTTPSNVQPLFNHNNNTSTTFCIVGDQQAHPLVNTDSYKKRTKYKERINTLLLVATLVATVTFACGFSVPGGFNDDKPDKGMATLARRRAFQVFVVTDTLAMCSAILSVISLVWAHLDDLSLVLLSLRIALPLLGLSLAMMLVAFISGFYLTVHTLVPWLGVVVLVIGGFFIFALLMFYIPLFLPLSLIRNKFLRYLFHFPFTLMLFACDKCKNGAHYSL